MVVRARDFAYVYRLWLEDDSSQEVPLTDKALLDFSAHRAAATGGTSGSGNAVATLLPLSAAWYDAIVRTQCGTQRGIRCLELYSLFLGAVQLDALITFNTALVSVIKKNI